MIVNESDARNAYTASAAQTTFVYDFGIIDKSGIEVIVDDVVLTLDSDYIVTGAGDESGGTIVLGVACTGDETVVLRRSQAVVQTSRYTREAFPHTRIENDLSKLAMISQMLSEILTRNLTIAKGSLNLPQEIPVPVAVDTFLRALTLDPLAMDWATLTAPSGAIALPLSMANGGSGANYANADALVKGISALKLGVSSVTPDGTFLVIPDPLHGNRIQVGAGDFSFLTTALDGTLLLLDYTSGGNTLTHSASLQLLGSVNYLTVIGEASLFVNKGGNWQEISRTTAVPIGGLVGSSKLTRANATNLVLSNGVIPLRVNGIWHNRIIPSGVFVDTTGLSATTLYYVYAFDNAGVTALELSVTGYTVDTVSGVLIKIGNASRTLVGMARTSGGTQFVSSSIQRFVLSHFGRQGIRGGNGYTTDRTTTSATYVEVNTEVRIEFLTWGDETVQATLTGTASANAAANCGIALLTDGSQNVADIVDRVDASGHPIPAAMSSIFTPSEGYHYLTIFAKTTAGTMTLHSAQAASTSPILLAIEVKG